MPQNTPSVAPCQKNLLIAFFDLSKYAVSCRNKPSREIFDFLNQYYHWVDESVHQAEGRVIKFIGDGGLAVFSEEHSEKGIMALMALKRKVDGWLKGDWSACSMNVKCHFGEAILGEIGGTHTARTDVMGENVNICARLGTGGVVLSPQAFRRLSPPNRKFFKKFTPPIVYHPVHAK